MSPFANTAANYRERGLAVMPCGPGTKFPGRYASADGWWKMSDWQKYCDRLPSHFEMDIWERWPDAGICLALGRSSAPAGFQLVAADIDTETPAEVAAICAVLPGSPVRKRGAKGETHFYLAPVDVPNRPYNDAAKRRMLDLLGHGRQTVLPPTIHPDTGTPYVWLTLDTLDNFDVADLPVLPADIADRLSAALAPFGHIDAPEMAARDPDAEASTHRTLNDAALGNLGAWVPGLNLYKCRHVGGKYKAVADWRPSSGGRPTSQRATNLAISSEGIKDCGDGKGYTPLDLVMAACGCSLDDAFRWLQERVAPAPIVTLAARATAYEAPAEPARRGNLLGIVEPDGNIRPVQPVAGDDVDEDPGAEDRDPALDLEHRAFEIGRADLGAALRRERLKAGHVGGAGHAPVDLWRRHEAPELPLGCLPAIIERFAISTGELMGADAAGLAMSALAVCASALNDDIQVQVKRHDPTWRESARLWVGLVGLPSTKKTPIMSAAIRPLRSFDTDMAARNAAALATWERLDKRQRDTTPAPAQPRRIVEDATIEALQGVLKDSPHGVISMQDELSGWFGAMDKYSPGKGAAADRAFWLKAFNGGPYSVNRVMRGTVFVPNLSISLLGGIQPEPLQKLAGESVDDGLIQRFLPVILQSATIGKDEPAGEAAADYDSLVQHLIAMLAPSGDGNLAGRPPLQFSDEALQIRQELEAEHAGLTRALEAVSPKLAAHFGKHDGIFARLCLLFHCIDHAGAEAPPAEIGESVAARVARFMRDYLRPSAIAFYAGLLGMSAGHEDLMALAGVIVSDRLEEISGRDVQRSSRSLRHLLAEDTRRICEKLEAFGWLESLPPRSKSNAPRWRVVPSVHDLFAERGRMEAERRSAAKAAFASAFGTGDQVVTSCRSRA